MSSTDAMNSATSADLAVLIGRFQPFHNGHAMLLKLALETASKVAIVLGSSFHARNSKNPFSWEQRAAMIAESLPADEKGRVVCVPVRDYYDDERWASAVRSKVEQQTGNPERVALIGHFKDASSYYLNHFPQWQLISVPNEKDIDASTVRRILFEAENIDISLDVIDELVPPAVRQYLKAWAMLPQYAALAEEHALLAADKAAWSGAPYPPIFSTVDSVVRAAEHVLLIKRGGFPGKGLWAIPGGYLEQRERVIQGAIRELYEETEMAVLNSTLESALVDVKVFDHPDRSLRGRTITHAHYFDLKAEHLPDVVGSDDASLAVWMPIEKLAGMEEEFFDDHFHILDKFLGLTAD
ncbi:bifunctional nicotinamide-nucleotide adenylyltransferase/Nudix hydroxylase [soil metagenome]